MKVLLLIVYVTSGGTYDVFRYDTPSQMQCQTQGREFAEDLLTKIPDVTRVSFRCKEVQ